MKIGQFLSTPMKKKSKKEEGKKAGKSKKAAPSETVIAQEKLFDFGGLPERNFKKNLGCG